MVEVPRYKMIIYPIIILALLIVAFIIFWRRAYFAEKQGMVEKEEAVAGYVDKATGWFHFKKKVNVEPEVSIEKETDPNVLKADELFKKRQYKSAEKWYLEAVRNNPKNPKIYSRLGIIYLEQRNYKDAIESLDEAIRLDQNIASRYFNLSYAHSSEGDKRTALMNAKKAIRLDPQSKKYRKWLDQLKMRS